MNRKMKILAVILLISMASLVIAQSPIESAITKHLDKREGFQVSTVLTGNVNGYDSELTIVQWTSLGPSYWKNFISVFSNQQSELDTEVIHGLVDRIELIDGYIVLSLKTKGPDDPRCCPSVIKEKRFHMVGSELSELP
jgi:hypothetical protein